MEICENEQPKSEWLESCRRALNYYRSKNLSLEVIVASMQCNAGQIPDEIKTFKGVNKNTQELHDGTMLLLCLKDCVNLIRTTLSGLEIMEAGDIKLKSEILNKIEGIVYFSKSIMKLYREKVNELQIIEKKQNHVLAAVNYGKYLEAIKNSENIMDDNDKIVMQKAEALVYKINLIRKMKAVLIGFTATNHPNVLSEFDSLRTQIRRNLTVDDFIETWNYGLNS